MQHLAYELDRLKTSQNVVNTTLLRHAAKHGVRLSRHEKEYRARFFYEVFKRSMNAALVTLLWAGRAPPQADSRHGECITVPWMHCWISLLLG